MQTTVRDTGACGPGEGLSPTLSLALLRMGLAPEDLSKAGAELGGLETRNLSRGETLLKEGEPPGEAFVVDAGLLQVFKRQPGGSEVLMAELGPGSIVGEMSLLTLEPRAATVVAGRETRVFVITSRVFADLVRLSNAFAVKVAKLSEERRKELARV